MAGNESEELFETLAAEAAPERIGEAVPRLRTAERRQVEWRPSGLDSGGPPMWTDENRARYNRDHLRSPSDVTDDEWAHVEPPPAKRGGGKRSVDIAPS